MNKVQTARVTVVAVPPFAPSGGEQVTVSASFVVSAENVKLAAFMSLSASVKVVKLGVAESTVTVPA